VQASRGQVVAFIDSDCIPEADWITAGVAALRRADFVGGRVKVLVRDPRSTSSAEAFERVFAFDFERYIHRKGFSGSGNLFCPREVFDSVGQFGKGVSEDVDWCRRARAAGFRIGYAPDAVVGHPARTNWRELRAKWRRVNREMYALGRTRPAGGVLWLARALALPISAVVHTPRVLTTSRLDRPGDRAAALAMLFRLRLWRAADSLALLLGSD
jgi:GT2 family glycosyltransferase